MEKDPQKQLEGICAVSEALVVARIRHYEAIKAVERAEAHLRNIEREKMNRTSQLIEEVNSYARRGVKDGGAV